MSIKQDYILRMIEQVIDMLLEKANGKSQKESFSVNFNNEETNTKFELLKNLVDDKKINEAENKLFEFIEEESDENFKLALLFYKYLNSKDDEFLEKSEFSREEIKDGLYDISKKYGYENLLNIYLL